MTLQRELGFVNEAMFKGQETPLAYDSKFHLGKFTFWFLNLKLTRNGLLILKILVEPKPRFTNFKLCMTKRSINIEKKPGLSP